MDYTIKKGDNLSTIAKRFNTTVKDLARLNKIKNVNRIREGSSIFIPTEESIRGKATLEEIQTRLSRNKNISQKSSPIRESKPQKKTSLFDRVKLKFSREEREKVQPSLLGNRKERSKKRSEPILPANIRQLVYDVFGGENTITEDNLKTSELEALKIAAKKALNRGSDLINYKDYETTEGSVYSDIGGSKLYGGKKQTSSRDTLGKLKDPSYSMKTLLGQATIAKDEDGNVTIIDRYNFNDAVDGKFSDYLADAKDAGKSLYLQARAIGKHFGSKEGEGSHIVINLGKV